MCGVWGVVCGVWGVGCGVWGRNRVYTHMLCGLPQEVCMQHALLDNPTDAEEVHLIP